MMIDVAQLLVPLVSGAVGGAGVSWLLGRRRPERRGQPSYKCTSCGHGLGYHADRKGSCSYNPYPSGGKHNVCACQVYVGEVPPPTLEELTRDA